MPWCNGAIYANGLGEQTPASSHTGPSAGNLGASPRAWRYRSLLLATSGGGLLLPLARHHLSKHHHAVAVHERHAREALAVLEGVAHKRLLRLEGALRHFVGLERVRVLHLLSTCLLAHLPLKS